MLDIQRFLPQHVNLLFQLKDSSLEAEYRDFSLNQQSSLYPIALSLSFIFMLILFIGMTILSADSPSLLVCSILVCISTVCVVIFGGIIGVLHYRIATINKGSILEDEDEDTPDEIPTSTSSGVGLGSNTSTSAADVGTGGGGVSNSASTHKRSPHTSHKSGKPKAIEEENDVSRIIRVDPSTIIQHPMIAASTPSAKIAQGRSSPGSSGKISPEIEIIRDTDCDELIVQDIPCQKSGGNICDKIIHSGDKLKPTRARVYIHDSSSTTSGKDSDPGMQPSNSSSKKSTGSGKKNTLSSPRNGNSEANSSMTSSSNPGPAEPSTSNVTENYNDEYHDEEDLCSMVSMYYRRLYRVNHYFLLAFQVFIITYTIRRSQGGICLGLTDEHSYLHYSHSSDIEHISPFQQMLNYFFCGNVPDHYLPVDVHVLLLGGPIITTVMFPSLDVKYIWLQMISSVIVFIAVFIHMEHIPSGLFLLTWLVTVIFVVGQLQLDKINHFYLHLRIMELFEENERNTEAMHINEMRYLIANMAHDLKTVSVIVFLFNCFPHFFFSFSFLQPLMSFTSAISMLEQFTQELEQACYGTISHSISNCGNSSTSQRCPSMIGVGLSMSASFLNIPLMDNDGSTTAASSANRCSLTREQIELFVANVKECVFNLNDTNAFMLMTINRCIDYAKAAKGLKLIPKYETIDLWEALQMPLNCMRNIQDKVTIELLPLPQSLICKYVITDRQWLQENILCLLANAVKYTNKGKVSITVSFFERMQSMRRKLSKRSRQSSSNSSSMYNHSGDGDSVNIASRKSGGGYNSVHSMNSHGSSSLSSAPLKQAWLMFSVEDNGIGIPAEAMLQLFKPFKQTQRLTGGTGLGLYSLAKRVEAIQGEYGVRKRKDGQRGSVFWFTIPYRPDESMLAAASTDAFLTNNGNGGLKTLRELSKGISSFDFNDIAEMGRRSRAFQQQSVPASTSNTAANGCIVTESGFGRLPLMVPPILSNRPSVRSLSTVSRMDTSSDPTTAMPSLIPSVLTQEAVSNLRTQSMDIPQTIKELAAIPSADVRPFVANEISPAQSDSIILDILLVDDAPTIVKMTSMMLRKLGHRITTAENGEVAVNTVENYWKNEHKCFDVILMDLQMPVMDGIEATKRIRLMERSSKSGEGCDLPRQIILGVSANSDIDTERQSIQSGADAFIAKPFKANIFMEVFISLRKKQKESAFVGSFLV